MNIQESANDDEDEDGSHGDDDDDDDEDDDSDVEFIDYARGEGNLESSSSEDDDDDNDDRKVDNNDEVSLYKLASPNKNYSPQQTVVAMILLKLMCHVL